MYPTTTTLTYHEGKIYSVLRKVCIHLRGVHPNVYVLMRLLECMQSWHQPADCECRIHLNGKDIFFLWTEELLSAVGDPVKCLPYDWKVLSTRGTQLNGTRRAHKKLDTQLLFKMLHLMRDGRLGDAQLFSRLAE